MSGLGKSAPTRGKRYAKTDRRSTPPSLEPTLGRLAGADVGVSDACVILCFIDPPSLQCSPPIAFLSVSLAFLLKRSAQTDPNLRCTRVAHHRLQRSRELLRQGGHLLCPNGPIATVEFRSHYQQRRCQGGMEGWRDGIRVSTMVSYGTAGDVEGRRPRAPPGRSGV